MPSDQTTRKLTPQIAEAQQLNELRLRIYRAKGGFLALGTDQYMPFINALLTREGRTLTDAEKNDLRQVMNGRLTIKDEPTVRLIERALEHQQAA